ncbi:MAG TPA: hypothetical protein ENL21_04680 [Caldithrix abyssi]|uniref:GH26 domain-containing protein n=1 Tax=Caldithrix abyssi TaxID=187145 RepID=A0A7V5H3A5_CALAY|nr:hypothetical protein [Caldithrix abyssi]
MVKISVFLIFILLPLLGCSQSTSQKALPVQLEPLQKAIDRGETLLGNSEVGEQEGQYPAQAFSICQQALQKAKTYLKGPGRKASESQIDSVVQVLYDQLTRFEASVVSELQELIDLRATKQTRYLYHNLKKLAAEKMLFGQHDATGYGVGWSGDDRRSDVKDVCGDYPALFSWDAYHIFHDNQADLERFIFRIEYTHGLGGVTTLCWHQYDPEGHGFYLEGIDYPVVASLLPGGQYHDFYKQKLRKMARLVKRLRGPKGESIPIIFRPYHEQNGNWFWWGKGQRSEQQYIDLWRFTVHYLCDSLNVHSFIYAFSPDGNQFESKNGYLIDYPGDDVVDVFGLDFYFGRGDDEEIKRFQKRVVWTVELAEARNKLPALTEVGDYYGFSGHEANLKIPNWYTRCFLYPVKYHAVAKRIAYGAVWRNASKTHHFAPYPGHSSVPDFLQFYKDDFTLFLQDLQNLFDNP